MGDDVDYLTKRAGLDGKTAVVTGGAGGLGWPISRDLARAGVQVALCDRDPAAVAAVTAELTELPVQTYVELADARVPDAMAAFFGRVDERFGGVDILVDVPGGSFVAR
jgi:3-oxoacyl-[acyl-carrier protein] reductase